MAKARIITSACHQSKYAKTFTKAFNIPIF